MSGYLWEDHVNAAAIFNTEHSCN